jgi:hypothetical protein
MNAGLTHRKRTVRGAEHIPDLHSGPHKRATGCDDGGQPSGIIGTTDIQNMLEYNITTAAWALRF